MTFTLISESGPAVDARVGVRAWALDAFNVTTATPELAYSDTFYLPDGSITTSYWGGFTAILWGKTKLAEVFVPYPLDPERLDTALTTIRNTQTGV